MNALIPSVLLRGSEGCPDLRAIAARLDELYGASAGTLIRKKGEVQMTGFYADFIEDALAGEPVFAPMMDFLGELLLRPRLENGAFLAEYVESEKRNLANAIASRVNDKRTYATGQLVKTMCAGEAYAVPRLGELEDVEPITPEGLYAQYRKVLAESRVELFYMGRKSAEDVAEQLRRVLRDETSYYLNFQIISALASLAKIDSFNDSYGWENPCQYYHYYTDHLLFSIGQITNRFQVNNRDSEKEKERKTLNRGNYQFSEDRFPLLSDKKARNVVEHIDEYNLNIIESNRGVGGFNLIDASTESTLVQTLRTNRHTHPYTLDLLSHELFIRRNDENLTISFEKLKSELLTLRKSVKSFMEISSFL